MPSRRNFLKMSAAVAGVGLMGPVHAAWVGGPHQILLPPLFTPGQTGVAATSSQVLPISSQPATPITQALNQALFKQLPFDDVADYEDATQRADCRVAQWRSHSPPCHTADTDLGPVALRLPAWGRAARDPILACGARPSSTYLTGCLKWSPASIRCVGPIFRT